MVQLTALCSNPVLIFRILQAPIHHYNFLCIAYKHALLLIKSYQPIYLKLFLYISLLGKNLYLLSPKPTFVYQKSYTVVTLDKVAKTEVFLQEEANEVVIFKTNFFINCCIHFCGSSQYCFLCFFIFPLSFFKNLNLQKIKF